jgi:hypothetical protein
MLRYKNMGGGLMQLVAYGAQDIYLTGNPQITFFKVVYRRHTNFSMETIKQTLNGTQSGVKSGSATCTISRNGDLVYKVYVTANSSDATNGLRLVSEVELEIGGQRIDRHYEEWNQVWNELSTPDSKALGLKSMVCDIGTGGVDGVDTVQIPLNFWFCRNPGLALPLIALQYHEVKLKFTWGDAGSTNGLTPEVLCDYIYLDTDERRRFAQVSHEYLIEQLQKETYVTGTGDKKLNFNHPIKELIWVNETNVTGIKYQLKLNGHDRFSEQPKEYFTLRQPFDYHTAVPRQNLPSFARNSNIDTLTGNATLTNFTDGNSHAILLPEKAPTNVNGNNAFMWLKSTNLLLLNKAAGKVTATSDIVAGDELFIVLYTGKTGENTQTHAYVAHVKSVHANGLATDAVGVGNWTAPSVTITADRTLVVELTEAPTPLTGLHDNLFNAGDLILTSEGEQIKIYKRNSQARTSKMLKDINVYSFALKPEEHQPSGTCNFSRIDNAQLTVSGANDGGGNIYAVNYNVLRIMSGMGGLAYSN